VNPLARLRLALAGFFLALAVPAVALVFQALERLQWEAFHQQQAQAEELARRIDRELHALVEREDARPVTEYAFLNVLVPGKADLLQRSPLASLPPDNAVPGLLGHFQIDNDGSFHAPFLPPPTLAPEAVGVSPAELGERQALAARLRDILRHNRLLGAEDRQAPAAAPTMAEAQKESVDDMAEGLASNAFERLERVAPASGSVPRALGPISELKLEKPFPDQPAPSAAAPPPTSPRSMLRREITVLPEQSSAKASRRAALEPLPIRTFESEVDGLSAAMLGSGELVLYRKVWRAGQRIVQGLLIAPQQLWASGVREPFEASILAANTALAVAVRGEVQAVFSRSERQYASSVSGDTLQGTLLYQTRLSAPFADCELVFSVKTLPAGAGARVVGWLGLVLGLVLCGGIALMYRLGLRQLAVVQQQQDFVAAVSHELKTPLTAIRMYAEMLREGWAPAEKRAVYYAFIHDESERLARLIHNVLSLARMTHQQLRVEPARVSVAQLADLLRSRAGSVLEQAGRPYRIECPPEALARTLEVDLDCFTQIVLNLVDNAVKFSAGAAVQDIEIRVAVVDGQQVVIAVRDFGPGIPAEQLDRIFELFYRAENALTRHTGGTGIGLALVQRLATAIGGRITVSNQQPGVAFSLCLRLD
jgi:two-component system phosphate regulon sensor histidine kinase PhoR